ncbi:MAG: hypothetical protein R3F53_24545 [Gammaproteobacteria bacterium]
MVGKSLLLRVRHGLLHPTAGRVDWNGQPLEQARRHQAMVFQRARYCCAVPGRRISAALAVRACHGSARPN